MSGISDKLHEKCAVVGVSTDEVGLDAAHISYQALFALQHRGVEASGIVTDGTGDKLHAVKKPGMVRDVFREEDLASLNGRVSVGHNRYSTNGGKNEHLQPVINREINFAFAHNGNLPDPVSLEDYLGKRRYRVGQYNDSELFGHAIASKLHGGRTIVEAVREVSEMAVGAYSCTMSYDGTLAAFRDPLGIRPLELGSFDGGMIVTSETCALDTVGAQHVRSLDPGELLLIRDGNVIESTLLGDPRPNLDVFELVYFARHDSYLYGERVNEVRRRFGRELALTHPLDDNPNTVVVPIPDTSVPAAEGYAEALGLRSELAVVKNRYVGRTFMQPNQSMRRNSLSLKHTMISERIHGKHVRFIDDSIVRGNTMPRLVQMARDMGALSVSVLIASAPVRFPDYYGVDTPDQSELMAAHMTVEEMRRAIGSEYLGFMSVSSMVRATNRDAHEFNLASFNGEYPVSIGRRAAGIR
ncbi:MAG: amidophosphoribosyltransferase, partial [Candidatus Saccharimonas sp.]